MELVIFSFVAAVIAILLRLRRDVEPHKANKDNNRADSAPSTREQNIADIEAIVDTHESAAAFVDLVHKDGAGSWPPRANYLPTDWPAALRPYREVLRDMAPLLPKKTPSLNDEVNLAYIVDFRSRYRTQLSHRIDLDQVEKLLRAADAGRWDVFPRDVYNAFYCCIATSRHAYRWATVPVVRVAQLEKVVDLPPELSRPWDHLQRHFGCTSESSNNTSSLVLNFDAHENHIFQINTGLSHSIISAEEAFARIFRDVEIQGVPIYTESEPFPNHLHLQIVHHTTLDRAFACHSSALAGVLMPSKATDHFFLALPVTFGLCSIFS